jgi:hypothetical protein
MFKLAEFLEQKERERDQGDENLKPPKSEE